MTNYTSEAYVQAQIDDIINDGMDDKTKNAIARSIRAASFSTQVRANSFQTIMSISNAMVGTSTLVFPILYREVGILTALIISILIAIISSKTCQILVEHAKLNEVTKIKQIKLDVPDTTLRILGVSNVILLYLSGMIYMILICNQIYPLLSQIFTSMGVRHAPQTAFSFNQMSYQWAGIGYFFIIFPLMCLRNLGVILKLVPLGFVSVITFFFFIIYKGVVNIVNQGASVFSKLTLITPDLLTIAGVFTMGLMVQSLVVPIAKNNRNQVHNKRDITIAFAWTWFVYQIVGIFGAISIVGIKEREGTQGSIVLDYFENDWMIVIVQILLLLQLTFVFPVLQYITRAQFFILTIGLKKPTDLQYYGFTLFYALSCLTSQMFHADLSLIISLCGAVIGMVQIYIIPSVLHLTCLYKKNTQVEEDKLKSNIQTSSKLSSTNIDTVGLMENVDLSQFGVEDGDLKCNKHEQVYKRLSRRARTIFYLVLVSFGVFICFGNVIKVIFI